MTFNSGFVPVTIRIAWALEEIQVLICCILRNEVMQRTSKAIKKATVVLLL